MFRPCAARLPAYSGGAFLFNHEMGARSQGGAKFPTGGDGVEIPKPASASGPMPEGQQIRCNPGADGHSPDERERGSGFALSGLDPMRLPFLP